MPTLPHAMLGPQHLCQGVTSPDTWRLAFTRHVTEGRRRYPGLVWPKAWRSVASVQPFVSAGSWKVVCLTAGCGEHPLVVFEWCGLSICFNCGATYEGVVAPQARADIERMLLARPSVATRNWLPSESVADLIAENRAHGIQEAA